MNNHATLTPLCPSISRAQPVDHDSGRDASEPCGGADRVRSGDFDRLINFTAMESWNISVAMVSIRE